MENEEVDLSKVKQALINIRFVRNLFRTTPNVSRIKENGFQTATEKIKEAIEKLESVILSQELAMSQDMSEQERIEEPYKVKFGAGAEVTAMYRGEIYHDVLYRYGVIKSEEGLFAAMWQDCADHGVFPKHAVSITEKEYESITSDRDPPVRIKELLTEKEDFL